MSFIEELTGSLEKSISSLGFLSCLYSFPYRRVVRREIDLAEISKSDVVLNVGCGAVPYTAVQLAAFSGAFVYALDRDPESASQAKSYVLNSGYGEQIEVIRGDGSENLRVEFSAAVVALQAEPKKDILDNLVRKSCPKARFVLREPKSGLKSYYDTSVENLSPLDQINHRGLTFCSSVYTHEGVKKYFKRGFPLRE